MIEIHGWVVIRDCYSEKDEGVFDMNTIIKNIQNALSNMLNVVDIDFSLRAKKWKLSNFHFWQFQSFRLIL
ncbi:hypothetical protein MOVS_09295 [Moraxella ovis]|uniref:Uncharacterized protein n=1 Tax=Moraxella ovis TaxID=29433 RepID=A0A378PSK2_9GAMM|nr:hypothetical protein [Moraxella ovis]ANB92134.1 hypothetical protein MOVS_09295 [Moraxella ovis]STY87909.1 Uncharacterised protein [Moraxella ovis]